MLGRMQNCRLGRTGGLHELQGPGGPLELGQSRPASPREGTPRVSPNLSIFLALAWLSSPHASQDRVPNGLLACPAFGECLLK